jgi:hypothetical protein
VSNFLCATSKSPSPLAGEGGAHCNGNGTVRGLPDKYPIHHLDRGCGKSPLTLPLLRSGSLPLPRGERGFWLRS